MAYSRTMTYSVCAIEDIVGHIIDADRRLSYLHIQLVKRAITDEDAEGLAFLTEARRELDTARRRLVACHPNKAERK